MTFKELCRRTDIKGGYNQIVSSGEGFRFIDEFGILHLLDSDSFEGNSQNQETALLILSGRCTVQAGDSTWEDVGERQSVFDGKPTAVYIPPNHQYSIKGQNTEIAICKGRCEAEGQPAIVRPSEVKIMQVGRDNWHREVRVILGPNSSNQAMIVGETLNPPGNWSGTPPHKHEIDKPPHESIHEELYYFKTDKPQGWGMQRIYSPERNINELIFLEDGMTTFIPWGYHQVVAAPGYTLYYLFFLAGPHTNLCGHEDPDHNWIKSA